MFAHVAPGVTSFSFSKWGDKKAQSYTFYEDLVQQLLNMNYMNIF